MIIIDTSIWIDLFRGDEKILTKVESLLENDMAIAIEPIFAELLQGAKSAHENKLINDYWSYLKKIPDTGLWLEAGEESAKHKWHSSGISLIDALIITTAWKHDLKIWTLDKKLAKAAGAKFIY